MKSFVVTCALALLACVAVASSEVAPEIDGVTLADLNEDTALHTYKSSEYKEDDSYSKSKLGCEAGDKFPCGKECKTFYKSEKYDYYVEKPVKYYETIKKPYTIEVPKKVPYYDTKYVKYPCEKKAYDKKDYGYDDKKDKKDYGYDDKKDYGYDDKKDDKYDSKKDGYGYSYRNYDSYDKKEDYGYSKPKYCTKAVKELKYKTEYDTVTKYKEEKVERVKYEKELKTEYKKVPYEVCYQWYCKTYTCTKHVDVEKIEDDKKY
ncbi:hypothetical protein FVE85_1784 [Porphyridium purpureum]|uniref:Uncharacterized protein n=1 Tax=Porphyridium purpureum TaxID=35688 RepID=A0A5J4YVU0_PORPP|nr:hypothetical protein FVE85_1784 [Porphyridium purpureum]|eukprot:POR0306..scf209_3